MKRKMRKFDDGGKVYDKEDEGILGGKVKYREDSEGRKYTAAPSNPMMRNSGEQRYYSVDDVKGKLSSLFGGKKEDEPKKSTTMPSGYEKLDATEGNARTRQISDYIKKSDEEPAKPAGKTFLREEADTEEKPAKKTAAPKKAAPAPKASMDAGIPKDTKSTRMPSGYEKLDVSEKKSLGSDAKPMKESVARTRAGTVVSRSSEPSAEDIAAAKAKGAEKLKKQYKENEFKFSTSKSPNRSYKSGGSVKSSASSRGDGCAVRGKTKGRIY
jgi:hypothetical protein